MSTTTELAPNGRKEAAAAEGRRGEAPRRYTVQEIDLISERIARSQLFGMNAPQAFTLMMICMSEGLDPIQALKRYHVIEGRPSMRADAMLAEFQRQGGIVQWEATDEHGCSAIFRHPRHAPKGERVEFTEADADRAGLLDRKNWQRYPKPMYRARVISAGIRMILPGIVAGIYTPEEMLDPLPEDVPTAAAPAPGPRPWRPSPAAPAAGPGPVPVPDPIEDVRAFIRRHVAAANRELVAALEAAGKLEAGRSYTVANEYEVANGLITQWIADGLIDEAAIRNERGKRDRKRAGVAVLALWSKWRETTEEDILDFIEGKRDEAYIAAGLEPPGTAPDRAGDADEAQAQADEDDKVTG